MTTQIKRRRGTTVEHASFTGAEGEITIDTTKDTVVVHDGSTAGGHPLAKENGSTFTNVDINSGTIDNAVIGGSTAAAGTFTTITGTSFVSSGNMTFGDNDKAIFGAGSDLQIYHDGANSYIQNVTNSLIIQNDSDDKQVIIKSDNGSGGVADYFRANGTTGEALLYHYGSSKLATTSTGIDVTGTVVADGLTVDGSDPVVLQHSATGPTLRFNNVDQTVADGQQLARLEFSTDDAGIEKDEAYIQLTADGGAGAAFLDIMTGDGSPTKTARFSNNGDISFYEDTGTTPKLFWDASAERLGIGTSSPTAQLTVQGGSVMSRFGTASATDGRIEFAYNNSDIGYINMASSSRLDIRGRSGVDLALGAGNAEAMRITSGGNVGIGTTLPSARLETNVSRTSGTNTTAIILSDNVTGAQTSGYGTRIEGQSNNGSARSAIGFEAFGGTNNDTGLGFYTQATAGGLTRQMTIDSSGRVGIGTSSPQSKLHIAATGNMGARIDSTNGGIVSLGFWAGGSSIAGITANRAATNLCFDVSGGEKARIDSSGNLLVGKTSNDSNVEGSVLYADSASGASAAFTSDGIRTIIANRKTSDGEIISIRKDGATVGSIGNDSSNLFINFSSTNNVGIAAGTSGGTPVLFPTGNTGAVRDNAVTLGYSGGRFKDLYLSGGVYVGGTTSANLLDDYEEGTWTPAVNFGGASAGVTYSAQSATYTKVGNMVTGRFTIVLTNKGSSSGVATIDGLPFTVGATISSATLTIATNFTSNVPVNGYCENTTTRIVPTVTTATGTTTIADTDFANNTRLDMTFTYFV